MSEFIGLVFVIAVIGFVVWRVFVPDEIKRRIKERIEGEQ